MGNCCMAREKGDAFAACQWQGPCSRDATHVVRNERTNEKGDYPLDEELAAAPVDLNGNVDKRAVLKKAAKILEVDLGPGESMDSYHKRLFRQALCLAIMLGEVQHLPEDGAEENSRPSKKDCVATEDSQARKIFSACLVILEAWKTEERKTGKGGTRRDSLRLEVLREAADILGFRFQLGESTRSYYSQIFKRALDLATVLGEEESMVGETCQVGAPASSAERPRGDTVCFQGEKASPKRIIAGVQRVQSLLKEVRSSGQRRELNHCQLD